MNKKLGNEVPALAVALLAATLGIGYYFYIGAVDFPAGTVRAIPFLWLILAIAGLVMAARVAKKSYISFVAMILSIPSLLLALVFAMAAMFGD